MPPKVHPRIVRGGCPYCPDGGWVLRGYKGRPGFQKCGPCHRVSWVWQKRRPRLEQ